ncbi:M50 family metallopeptidase [Georgenia wangjunii]|uniref:M50 family metallopeptidase n=1 Tax=Georgenia wangjunii TaxID=3117730 RepID=UPI002F261B9C
MDPASVWEDVLSRLRPGPALGEAATTDLWVGAALAAGVAVVLVPVLWRLLRVVVTVVHELGHAVVGMAVGRSFTGLVLRADMSGHAVTVGRSRGPGRVVTTWAGYPAPAIVGAGLVHAGSHGWAAPVLAALVVLLAVALVRSRSLFTAVIVLATFAGTGWLWWAGGEAAQGLVLVSLGVVLLLGAWRHLGAVMGARERGSDPAVLAQLTPLPAGVWTTTFALVLGAASWLTARHLWELLVH